MNIAVLFGGISTERNVSLVGGKAVCEALSSLGHNVFPIDPAFGINCLIEGEKEINLPDLTTQITSFVSLEELIKFQPRSYMDCINSPVFDNIDCAFIVLHGKYGEDGHVQSLLDLRGIPYTGSNTTASAIAMDKHLSKMMFVANGIVVPPWELILSEDIDDEELLLDIYKMLGKQLVIKPADQGSTVGITMIKDGDIDIFTNAVYNAAQYTNRILIEKYIAGREFTVAIVDDQPLSVIEIATTDGFFDYEHKYKKGKTNYICPANLSADIAEFMQNTAVTAYNALGCSCFGRVDFILTEDGQPVCLEVNTIPGFSTTSLVPMAAMANEIDFPTLCQDLIDLTLKIPS